MSVSYVFVLGNDIIEPLVIRKHRKHHHHKLQRVNTILDTSRSRIAQGDKR